MANLYIMVGIPGCGKSTWIKNYFGSDKVAVVSSDAIRLELSQSYDQTRNDEVFRIFHERIKHGLRLHEDVVADATHLTRRSRVEVVSNARKYVDRVHIVFFKNTDQAIARNRARGTVDNGMVPEDVMMEKMLPRYEDTCRDPWQERYDSVTEIKGVR